MRRAIHALALAWVAVAVTGCTAILDIHELKDESVDSSVPRESGSTGASDATAPLFDGSEDGTVLDVAAESEVQDALDGDFDAMAPDALPIDGQASDAPAQEAGGQLGASAPCANDGDCSSGHCADGVCCNNACTGSCQQCNLPGYPGTCSPVAAGGSPLTTHPACAMTAASACGQNGTCDGTGNCAFWPNATACGGGSCDSTTNTATSGSTCNGQGACQPAQSVSCAPYVCAGTTCSTTCNQDSDCIGQPCVNHSCGQVVDGTACTSASQCQSGNCVDGYCCNLGCTGSCQACDVSGSEGKCTTVPSGQPHATRAACAGSGTCQGSCNGSSTACTYPTVNCAAASCGSGVALAASSCNGAGACSTQASTSCSGYACNGTVCYTSCTGNSMCSSSAPYCYQGACVAALPNSAPCTSGSQCSTGNCVDGYCCNSTCTGSCQACDVSGSAGICTTVTSGQPHGTRSACGGSGTCQGSCNGSGTSCSYPTGLCAAASCSGGTEMLASSCNGAGSCPAQASQSCGGYACNGATCYATCSGNSMCAGSSPYCYSGSCYASLPNGATCSTAAQCSSGYCSGSTCCSSGYTGCSGTCLNVMASDANNCGACGHSCQGGTCSSGVCQSWTVSVQGTGSTAMSLAADGTYVAWTNNGSNSSNTGVFSIPIAGTSGGLTPTQLSGTFARGVAIENAKIAWVIDSSSSATTLSFVSEGSTSVTTASANNTGGSAFSLGLNPAGTFAYVADTGGSATGFAIDDCSPENASAACSSLASVSVSANSWLSTPAGAFVFTSGTGGYFVAGGASSVVATALPGGAKTTGSGQNILAVAADSANAYWLNTSSTSSPVLSIAQAPLGNLSSATSLVSGISAGTLYVPLGSLASDGSRVYLATISASGGTSASSYIAWVKVGGGSLSSPIYQTPNVIVALTYSGGVLYWAEYVNNDVSSNLTINALRYP